MRYAALLIAVALSASDLRAASPNPIVADSLVFRFHESWDCYPCSLVEITGKYGHFSPPVALALAAGESGYFGGGALASSAETDLK
jgi:hypothetical protein